MSTYKARVRTIGCRESRDNLAGARREESNISRRNRVERGACPGCGGERNPSGLYYCDPCRTRSASNQRRVRAEANLLRAEMIAKFGNPADIWLDNDEKAADAVIMRPSRNILRAQRVLDSWAREA